MNTHHFNFQILQKIEREGGKLEQERGLEGGRKRECYARVA